VRVLGLLLLPVAFAFAVIFIAARVVPVHAPSVAHPPTGTVWAGRVFVQRTDFARWLRSKGASYQVWTERHPPPRSRPATPPATPSIERSLQKTLSAATGSNLWKDVLLGGASALLLAVVAMFYRRLPSRRLGNPTARLRTSTFRRPRGFRPRTSGLPRGALQIARLAEFGKATGVLADLRGSVARLPRGPGPRTSVSLNGTVQTLRHAQWTISQAFHRRAEVGWCVAAACLALTVVVLLPHL
jgi:hypothetical protein